jgi:glycosyltransferase involved in cell wall biosynthesis
MNGMFTVAWLFRKRQPFYFSIEKVFDLIEPKVKQHRVDIQRVYMQRHKVLPGTILKNILFARKVKANLYHITGDVHYLALGLPSRKTILTIHDCVFMYQTRGIKRMLLYFLFLKWPVKRSRIVTTISERTRQDIIRFTNCSPDKIVVIGNPLDERFEMQPYVFNKSCPLILFIGITPNKNLFRVIEALEGIACRLHIIGKIPEAEKEQLQKKGIDFRESYELSDEEIIDAYIKSDMILFPSLFEGFGLPVIEAQSIGRPVITSNIEPMNEVAGDAACLVDPNSVESIREAVRRLIENDEYRATLISRGSINIQRYKPEIIAARYLALYDQIQSAS